MPSHRRVRAAPQVSQRAPFHFKVPFRDEARTRAEVTDSGTRRVPSPIVDDVDVECCRTPWISEARWRD